MPDQPNDLNQVYYRDYYQFKGRSQWMEKIWSEAFGEAYPVGLGHYGYLTQHDLQAMGEKLEAKPGDAVLDIGCGKGGPGLFLARAHQLKLIGVDIIPEAVQLAHEFKAEFELVYPANFAVGHFMDLPLEDNSVDAVISIDSLWAAHHKILAMMEVKRVLKPGGKFIFTNWDLLATDPVPLLEPAGLTFVSREETPNWKEYQQKVYAGIAKYQQELVDEMGAAANMLLYEAQASPPHLDLSVRRLYHWELKKA